MVSCQVRTGILLIVEVNTPSEYICQLWGNQDLTPGFKLLCYIYNSSFILGILMGYTKLIYVPVWIISHGLQKIQLL